MKQTVFKYKGEEIVKISNTEYRTMGHTYCSYQGAKMHIDRENLKQWEPILFTNIQFSMN